MSNCFHCHGRETEADLCAKDFVVGLDLRNRLDSQPVCDLAQKAAHARSSNAAKKRHEVCDVSQLPDTFVRHGCVES